MLRNIAQYCSLFRAIRTIDVVSGTTSSLFLFSIPRQYCSKNERSVRQYCASLSKDVHTITIENGRPVHIPDYLSQDHQRHQYCAILAMLSVNIWRALILYT